MKLTFASPITRRTGYGITGINTARGLIELGNEVTLLPMGPVDIDDEDRAVIESHLMTTGRGYDPKAPVVRNFHEFDVQFPPGTGKKVVWPFFEVDELQWEAVHQLNQCDAVAAPSTWAEEVLRKNGVEVPIFLIHSGVDTELFKPREVERPRDEYRFYTAGKYEIRKGYPELIEAFLKAFPHEKDVSLYLLCHNSFLDMRQPGYVAGTIMTLSRNDSRVKVMPPLRKHEEVALFFNACDCGVFPARAEGFGMPCLESLASGNPVMSTFVTAQKDYLTHEAATEIATDGLEKAEDGMFFHGRGRWYKPNVESIVQGMREMYESKRRDNPEGMKRAAEFTWKRTAGMMTGGLQCL